MESRPPNLRPREPTYVRVGTQMVPTRGFPGRLRSIDLDVQEEIERELREIDHLAPTMHPVLASAPGEEDDSFSLGEFSVGDASWHLHERGEILFAERQCMLQESRNMQFRGIESFLSEGSDEESQHEGSEEESRNSSMAESSYTLRTSNTMEDFKKCLG